MTKKTWSALVAIALAGCGSTPVSSALVAVPTAPPETTAAPAPTPTQASATAPPSPSISPGPPAWHSVGATTGLEDVTGADVAAWFIAATSDGFLGAAGDGLLASLDGATWTQVVSSGSPVTAIAVGPNGALAVGDGLWARPATVTQP